MKRLHFGRSRLASALIVSVLTACAAATRREAVAPKPEALKPTCLALSVGGPAGVAHLGAIESLRAHGVEISCVVGNSMGALVGALYASNPHRDTTEDFRSVIQEYVAATKEEAVDRGVGAGLAGLAVFGPLGALLGGMAGATSVDRLNHDRLVDVLDKHLLGARIEALPVPYATSHEEARDGKGAFVEVREGNLAQELGASIANPFIFKEIDVREGGPIDPGMDRVAAVPIEQTCATFPDHRILAVNVMQQAPFFSTRMHCPAFEIRVAVSQVTPESVLTDPVVFAQMVKAGRTATDAWFTTPEGQQFLAVARRMPAQETNVEGSELSSAGMGRPPRQSSEAILNDPQWYMVQVVSAELASHKPSGEDWDAVGYGLADPRVVLEVQGDGNGALHTPIAQDTLTPTWDLIERMHIAEGDFLDVTVWDADAFVDDEILSVSVPFVGPKRYVIREPDHSLNELVIEVWRAPQ